MWCATVKTDLAGRGSFWLVVPCCESVRSFSDAPSNSKGRLSDASQRTCRTEATSTGSIRFMGPGYAAFPSGYMVAIGAILSWLGFCIGSRAICAICIAMVFIRQFGANYHIVRDLIAGGFPGFAG